ncbi:MAG: YicC family protein [Calditrichaceae bacterium]|nr:YicC family protein [Calditrichaceae bacterium]
MRSMTGFGKAQIINKNIELEIEIRSVNSRYLDISVRLPNTISAYEMPVREKIKEKVIRGKVTIYANLKKALSVESGVFLDNAKIQERFNQIKSVKELLKIDEDIKISHLLAMGDLFEIDLDKLDENEILDIIIKTLNQALDSFNSMRDSEGNHILKDMLERNNTIAKLLSIVEKKSKLNVQQAFDRQLENVKNLIAQDKIDQDRLNMEIALIADRVDITEECVRMHSHIKLFEVTCNQKGESGKKLNFILQEMLREANTMNSKTNDIEVSHIVIKIKEEIEKLREQAQNIE